MRKNKLVGMTIPIDVSAMVESAAIMRAQEGEPIGEREMLNRAGRAGAIMLTRCQGCRSGKCSRHVAMVPSLVADVASIGFAIAHAPAVAVAMADHFRETNLQREAREFVSTPSNKPIETAADTLIPPVQAEASKFALATVEPVKKPERKPRAKKPVDENSPAYSRVCDAYQNAFLAVKKCKPKFGAREGKTIRELLERYDVEALLAMIARAFANTWWAANKGTILAFALDPDQFVGEAPTSSRRSSGQVDPDENFFADQEKRWSQENAS